MNRLSHHSIVFLLLFIMVACRTIQPALPQEKVVATPELTQNVSVINLPIKINLSPYFDKTDKSLPLKFVGKEDRCEGVSYAYEFERNRIQFQGKGNTLSYELEGRYALKINYCPECTNLFHDKGNCIIPRIHVSCGVDEPMRRAAVGYTTSFVISPTYQFISTTTLNKFETMDPCEVSIFQYDATEKLKQEVTKVLKDLESDIDKQIQSISIKKDIKETWEALSQSIPLGNYGFLTIQPQSIALSDIRFNKEYAIIDLNLVAKPVIATIPTPCLVKSLPDLAQYKTSNGFDINMDIIASYDSLSSILTQQIAGKKTTIKKSDVIFNSVEIQGANNQQLNLKVVFEGKRKGTLYLNGTPHFDSINQQISFPDLHFDLATKNLLLKTAKWLFNEKITTTLRENAKLNLSPHLLSTKKMIQKEMNIELKKGVFLSGKLDTIHIKSIYPEIDRLIIRLNAQGDLALTL
jgi:hypothetical protein